jgi:multidrug efflux system membrane fusion protein
MNTTTPTEVPSQTGSPNRHESDLPTGPRKKGRGFIWIVLFLIVAGVAGYAVWRAGQPVAVANGGRGGGPGGGGGRGAGGRGGNLGPVPVVVTTVSRTAVPVYLNGLGNVTAFYTNTVHVLVNGELQKVLFNEGDLVKQGQVLAQVDPRPYQAALDQAEGTLARDQALLSNAYVDLDRYKGLLAQNAIPSQQLDTQVALVAQYEGTIKLDKANIEAAQLNVTYSQVKASITGVVGLRLVDPGNIVHTTDANGIIVITQLQPIAVDFTLPEDTLPQVMKKLRAGAKLPAEAWSRDNATKLASGTLQTVNNQIDNTTGTAQFKAVFPNEDNALFPQQFVNIRLLVDTLQNQLVVPGVAVQNGQQGTFVYTVDDDSKVHLKTVTVGVTNASVDAITAGLNDGDRVVVDGTDRLVDGATVRVRKAGELEAAAAADAAVLANRGRGGKKGNFKKGDKKGDFKKKKGGDN